MNETLNQKSVGATHENACRELSAKEMLMSKAEGLRLEAHDLETLAREIPPEGAMSRAAERTLQHIIAARIYR